MPRDTLGRATRRVFAVLAFLDEDFPPVATEPEEGGPLPPERQRQFMVRRLVAVGVGVLIVILIVLGIRGCLNARKERAFENYVSDLNTLASGSDQLSQSFFQRLEDPKNLTVLQFETEVKADRGTAEGLVQQAEALDPPDELNGAQERIELAFELRRDGLAAIADSIGAALGEEERTEALDTIALQMQDFLAGDVLYRGAKAEIDQVLAEEEIDDKAPESQFLPGAPDDAAEWLDPTTVSEDLAQITGVAAATAGVHGLGLLDTTVGGVPLSTSAPTTVSGGELEVSVQNQGDSEESEIPVQVSVTGGDEPIDTEEVISSIAPGATRTVTIPLEPAPATGTPVTIEVFVEPVLGEQVADNNEATYEVTFE